MFLGLSGAFCPTNFPLFQASPCGCSRVPMIDSLLLIGVRFLNSLQRAATRKDAERVLLARGHQSPPDLDNSHLGAAVCFQPTFCMD